MVQREWVEKDFYKVLGVSSDAKEDEIKRVARKLLAENHPDRNPNDTAAEERYKEVGEAKDVLLVAMPLRLTSPAPCTNCHGSGARPGTSPKVCASCNGSGMINRNQGAFGFSEPCTECRGSGSIIENPCDDCRGSGVTTRTRTINVRIPPGVEDGQRIRLAGQGEAGLRGAPSGDLYVTVHVRPDRVFGRDGDDLTVTVPVSFTELALGATLSVPTLDGKVGVKVPKGTADGRILRVRGRGVPKRSGGSGDLLVTVKVAVPPKLDDEALGALEAYAAAEKASGFDPRAGWAGNRP
ncbi:MAG: DnaJ domain-containing protein [Mycobacterium sp.]|nr:DnaJ domain-containing protein [Mycobacterium sp.]